jgi:hypothetical protein
MTTSIQPRHSLAGNAKQRKAHELPNCQLNGRTGTQCAVVRRREQISPQRAQGAQRKTGDTPDLPPTRFGLSGEHLTAITIRI